ncbi:hypothetical protein F4861DRAFT_400582 [Xylaria intraflava]|nr:hypothetical protein F4861DRAFT_400582 [Xylaria intraflava]
MALQKKNYYEVITAYVPYGIPGILVDGTYIATSTMILLPTSRGTISIRSSSPSGRPRIQPGYSSVSLDRDVLIHAAGETARVLTESEAMKPIIEGEAPPSGEDLAPLTADASDE